MSDKEWNSTKGSLFRQEDNVHTNQELNDLVCKEQALYDMHNRPQYKFILIPEFQPGKSVMIMKVHHSFSDGLGLATLFQCLTDVYDPKNLPAMKPVGFLKNLFIHLISPFLILQTIIETSAQKEDMNAINHGQALSGIKTGGFSYDLDLGEIKAYCKSANCTINDYTSSLLSVALHEYSSNEEKKMIATKADKVIPVPASVHIAVPFSMRQPFKTVEDVKMGNDFGSILIDMRLFASMSEALPYMKKTFGGLKSSLNPFAVLFATKITVTLPFLLPKILAEDLTRKFTIVYSNLLASKKVYEFDGKKMLGTFFYPPGNGRLGTGFSILTVGGIMSVGCFSDKSQMEDP